MQTSLPAPAIGAFITALAALAVAGYNTYRTWKLRRDEFDPHALFALFQQGYVHRAGGELKSGKKMDGRERFRFIDALYRARKAICHAGHSEQRLGGESFGLGVNISVWLHFFAELAVYSELGLLNQVAIKRFFGDIYEWWSPFVSAFAKAYLEETRGMGSKPVIPSWVESVAS